MKVVIAIGKILLAWMALIVAQIIAGIVVPVKMAGPSSASEWLLSNLLIAAAVSFVAARSDWRGWRLGLGLAAISCGVTTINFIEGWVFLTGSGISWGRVMGSMIVSYALAVPLWVLIFRWRADALPLGDRALPARPLSGKLWRFAVSDVVYFTLYITAGTIIFPYVREFYAAQTLPPLGKLAVLQLALRGPLLVGICILLVRMIGLSRALGALATAVVFVVISGIAPLIVPNPIFPDTVRLVHLCEVTGSNSIFGAFVAWLWSGPSRTAAALKQAA
jgi:hypothetical protein